MKTAKKIIINSFAGVAFGLCNSLIANAAPDPNFHIYLMIGQSNMAGAGTIEAKDKVSHPKVHVMQDITCGSISTLYGQWRPATPPLIWCPGGTDGLGPGDYFGKGMGDAAAGNVTIGLVGAAYPGAPIEYFLKDCATRNECAPPFGPVAGAPNNGNSGGYKWIMDLATRAQERGIIKGIIFHQGESNTGNKAQWPGLVNQMVTALRNDLGLKASDVPFIAAELVCCGMNDAVRRLPSVIENGHYVSADGLTRKDDFHMDSESNREIGRRFATKMIEVGNSEPQSCGSSNGMPVCCSILDDDNGDGVGSQNGQACIVAEGSAGWHPANPSDVVRAINVGGSGDSLSYNDTWFEPDRFFFGGTTNATTEAIAGGAGSAVFQTERYGSYAYKIPVVNGHYEVQLGMVEIFQSNPGLRTFHVDIEGQRVINGIDLYQQVGRNAVLHSDSFATVVSDELLDITVTSVLDNGTLSTILVKKFDAVTASSVASSTNNSISSAPLQTTSSSIAPSSAVSMSSSGVGSSSSVHQAGVKLGAQSLSYLGLLILLSLLKASYSRNTFLV